MNLAKEAPVTLGLLVLYGAAFIGFRLYEENVDFAAAGSMRADLVANGQIWRLVTYSFLHANPIHLLFNSYFLMMVGPLMERELGAIRYLALYLVASVTGALAVFFFSHGEVVGGSGGLFGLIGGMVAVHARAGRYVTEFLEWHSGRALLNLIVINLIIGFLVPKISQAGHVGGLAGGFLFTFLYLRGPKQADLWTRAYQVGFGLLFLFQVLYCGHPFLRV